MAGNGNQIIGSGLGFETLNPSSDDDIHELLTNNPRKLHL